MQRRVYQTECNRLFVHYFHCSLDRLLYMYVKLVQPFLSFFCRTGKYHLSQNCKRFFGVFAVEHVLYPEQSYSFGTKVQCLLSIFRCVGICSHSHGAILIHNLHELFEKRVLGCVNHRNFFAIYQSLCSVQT